jgi:hypothetical protein
MQALGLRAWRSCLIIESRQPILRLVIVANQLRSFVLIVGLVCVSAVAFADPSDSWTGEQIAQKIVQASAFDANGAKSRLKMLLLEKAGGKSERVFDILARRKDGLAQSVIRFGAPADVAGTAFLMLEQRAGGTEQYIYLPKLRRTRRISGRGEEGSFMGSDFNHSDFRRIDAVHKRLPDEKVGDAPAFVVEAVPKKEAKSSYSKLQFWIRKSDFVPLRTRFFDADGSVLKTLYARRVGKFEDKPLVLEARMENQKTGHATLLVVEAIEKKAGLPDSLFTPTALEHP